MIDILLVSNQLRRCTDSLMSSVKLGRVSKLFCAVLPGVFLQAPIVFLAVFTSTIRICDLGSFTAYYLH